MAIHTHRYKWLNDHRVVLCRECSTRTTGVMVPTDEVEAHDAWHDSVQGNDKEEVRP